MDIEQRVKSLEQEMKILKNQVQKTLLDIQEQILVHYHPALRTEDESYDEISAPARGATRPAYSNGQPAADFEPNQPTGLKVRQVSLADLRETTRPLPEKLPATATPPAAADQSFAGLVDWVGGSVAKIGAERTRKLLDLRASSGAVPPDVYDTLQQLIVLCDENEGADAAETAVLLQQLAQLLN
ncbi:MAG: hypothetical protein KA362_14935 [Chloroflexi bacterium]|nr:hypothetical protein [Chloroflexota bacterium]